MKVLNEKGISHYIEHMIFKGTKNRTFQKLNDDLEALGGEYNAYHRLFSNSLFYKLFRGRIKKCNRIIK